MFNFLQNNSLSKFELGKIFLEICEAVKEMHRNGLVHRDIKPENILLDENLNPKLSDFGWSAMIKRNELRSTFCGTFEYMAPEILESEKYDNSVDMWSLGILLYEFLQGKSPFEGDGVIKIYQKIVSKKIEFTMDINPYAVDLIFRLLKKDPRERFNIDQVLNCPYLMEIRNQIIFANNTESYKKLSSVSTLKSGVRHLGRKKKKKGKKENKSKNKIFKMKSERNFPEEPFYYGGKNHYEFSKKNSLQGQQRIPKKEVMKTPSINNTKRRKSNKIRTTEGKFVKSYKSEIIKENTEKLKIKKKNNLYSIIAAMKMKKLKKIDKNFQNSFSKSKSKKNESHNNNNIKKKKKVKKLLSRKNSIEIDRSKTENLYDDKEKLVHSQILKNDFGFVKFKKKIKKKDYSLMNVKVQVLKKKKSKKNLNNLFSNQKMKKRKNTKSIQNKIIKFNNSLVLDKNDFRKKYQKEKSKKKFNINSMRNINLKIRKITKTVKNDKSINIKQNDSDFSLKKKIFHSNKYHENKERRYSKQFY